MVRLRLLVLIAGIGLLPAGCVHAPTCRLSDGAISSEAETELCAAPEKADTKSDKDNDDDKDDDKDKDKACDQKNAKTLFKWAIGANGEDKKNGSANGDGEDNDGNGNGDEPDEDEPLESDRPDFTESSKTVGKGRIQLESGYTYLKQREGGTLFQLHSYPEAILRIGLFADWFELRLGKNFLDGSPAVLERTDDVVGGEDLYLGVKLALTEQQQCLPEMALILQTTAPAGPPEVSATQMLPGANLCYSWDDIIKDCLGLAGSLLVARDQDDVGHFYLQVAPSLSIEYTLTKKLAAYTEGFCFFPSGSTDPDTAPEYYLDGGFTYHVTNNLQLDIRAGVGLNDHSDNFFTGAGLVVRH